MENNECIGPVYRNDRICTATTIAALERELAVVRTLSTGDDCHGPIGNC